MSAAQVIKSMGAAVALDDGKLKLSGLDRLPADVAERVLDVARKRREELVRELSGASAPGLPRAAEAGRAEAARVAGAALPRSSSSGWLLPLRLSLRMRSPGLVLRAGAGLSSSPLGSKPN